MLYSFQCEHCGKNSGTLTAVIVGPEATDNSNFKSLSPEREEKLCSRAHVLCLKLNFAVMKQPPAAQELYEFYTLRQPSPHNFYCSFSKFPTVLQSITGIFRKHEGFVMPIMSGIHTEVI